MGTPDSLTILFDLARKYIPVEHRPLLFSSDQHEPNWHQFSLIGHTIQSVEFAFYLQVLTGIDVTREALLHDVGKLKQFGDAMRNGRSVSFIGHEQVSARIVREIGMGREFQLLVRHHDVSYRHRPDRVLGHVCSGNKQLLTKLLILATADTVAKGWTEAQRQQRPEVAAKFQQVCKHAELESTLAPILTEAILNW